MDLNKNGFIQKNFYTGCCGRFIIYLNKDKNLLYKKCFSSKLINDLKDDTNYYKYKNIIEGFKDYNSISNYILFGNVFNRNGDYICEYLEGYRLDHLYRINDIKLLNKIELKIYEIIDVLKKNINYLAGDWGVQNLFYSLKYDKILNIDPEGFFTYSKLPIWGKLDKIVNNLKSCIYSNKNMDYFTAIIWNPVLEIKDEIIKLIPNIITYDYFIIDNDNIKDIIYDIYLLDTRCNKDKVLPNKIKKLQKYDNNHLIIQFKLDEPKFNKNNLSENVIKLKNNIRNNFKNYDKYLMIHIADNYNESRYIYYNYFPNIKFDIYIKKIEKYKLIIKKDYFEDYDIILSVYKNSNNIKNNEKFFCYCIDSYFYFSKVEKNIEPEFIFYTNKYMIKEFKLID